MTRLINIIVRVAGVLTAFVLIAFSILGYIPADNKADQIWFLFQGTFYFVLALCLLIPFRLIKKATTAYWFFRIFLGLGLGFALTSFDFNPIIGGFIMAFIILANIWVFYIRLEKLLSPTNLN
jgi:hypothetical protein